MHQLDFMRQPAVAAKGANDVPEECTSNVIDHLAAFDAGLVEAGNDSAVLFALSQAITRACDVSGDDEANRAALLAEWRMVSPEHQADLLAYFTIEVARLTAVARGARDANRCFT